MAKISITGNAVVLTSSIKREDLEKVKKYRKDALCLYDEENHPTFRVDIGDCAQANEFGIVFDGKTHDENGFATYTALIPPVEDGLKDAIADIFGPVVLKLGEYEETFPLIISKVNEERNAILETITLQ